MDVKTAIYNKLRDDFRDKFNKELIYEQIDNVLQTQADAIRNSIKDGESIRLKYLGSFKVNPVATKLVELRNAHMNEGLSFSEAHKKAKDYVTANIKDIRNAAKSNKLKVKTTKRLEKDKRKRINRSIHLPLDFNK